MICVAEIKLGKDGGSLDGLEGGRDEWQRIFIFNSDLTKTPIVNAGPKAFICHLHEEKTIVGKRMVCPSCCLRFKDVALRVRQVIKLTRCQRELQAGGVWHSHRDGEVVMTGPCPYSVEVVIFVAD